MRRFLVVFAVGLGLILSASADAETVRKKIRNNSDLVYTWYANESNATQLIAMWDKSGSDIDLYAGYFDSGGNAVYTVDSYASTDGLEVTQFGVVEDVEFFVVVTLFRGSSAKFQMNVSTTGYETVFGPGDQSNLRFVGELQTLAAADERFAAMARELEERSDRKADLLGR